MAVSRYVLMYRAFWQSRLAMELHRQEDQEGLILATWLISAEPTNYAGLFRAPKSQISHDTLIPEDRVFAALQRLADQDFLTYDTRLEWAWVHSAARYQLALLDDQRRLAERDTRVKGVARLYETCPSTPLKQLFAMRYSWQLRLNVDIQKAEDEVREKFCNRLIQKIQFAPVVDTREVA